MKKLLFVFLISGNIFGQNFWNQVTSFPGTSVSDIATNPQGQMFISTNSYGVVFSSDNGSTWVQKNGGISYMSAYGLAIDNVNNVYRSAGSYKSTNNGNSWFDISNGNGNIRTGRVFCVGPQDFIYTTGWDTSNVLHASGPFKSTDHGNTWITLGAIVSNNYRGINTFGFGIDGSLFAATWSDWSAFGVYKSTDQGLTWSSISVFNNATVRRIATNSNGYLFIAHNTAGIYFSSDNGNTWQQKNNGLTNLSVRDIYISSINNIYIATGNGVFRSTNNGDNWTQIAVTGLTSTDVYHVIVNRGYLFTAPYSGSGLFKSQNPIEPSTNVTWQSILSITDNCSGTGHIYFGTAPNATNALDPNLGEAELPPVPPTGVFDSRFILPLNPAIPSLKDFRPDGQLEIDWKLTFQPGSCGYPLTFSWESSSLPEGSVYLKDEITGTIVNVNMKTQNSYTLTNTGITSLKIVFSSCVNVTVFSGWNLVSVPLVAPDMNFSTLFPSYLPPAYGYNNGYVNATSAQVGKGYWIKFNAPATFQICGTTPNPSIPLVQGWNIIGPNRDPITVNQITTTPPGIITTSFYGMTPSGYQIPTTLEPGKGYWVKSSQNGSINTSLQDNNNKQIDNVLNTVDITFNVNDAAGSSGIVYAGSDESATNGLDPFLNEAELPPLPPLGVFDVRFNLPTNPVISSLRDYRQGQMTNPFSHQYEIQYQVGNGSVINLSWNLSTLSTDSMRIQDMLGGIVINNLYLPGPGSLTVSNPGALNKLKIFIFYKPLIVPVELTSFTADYLGTKVNLQWSTASETNNMGFDIEKSSDQNNWTKLGFVPGSGTTTKITHYSYLDDNILNGISYYRLKQIDFDGSVNYSPIVNVEVAVPQEFILSQNYPNPFNPTSKIDYALPNESFVTLSIYNILGDEIAVLVNEKKPAGSYSLEFDATNLPSGVYFYRLQADSFVDTKKMTLVK